jgi:hypothetical protein
VKIIARVWELTAAFNSPREDRDQALLEQFEPLIDEREPVLEPLLELIEVALGGQFGEVDRGQVGHEGARVLGPEGLLESREQLSMTVAARPPQPRSRESPRTSLGDSRVRSCRARSSTATVPHLRGEHSDSTGGAAPATA